jgi:hypothetical protein
MVLDPSTQDAESASLTLLQPEVDGGVALGGANSLVVALGAGLGLECALLAGELAEGVLEGVAFGVGLCWVGAEVAFVAGALGEGGGQLARGGLEGCLKVGAFDCLGVSFAAPPACWLGERGEAFVELFALGFECVRAGCDA